MTELRIKALHDDATWQLFGFQFEAAVADRDNYRARIERRLGQDVAAKIKLHVDVSLGRRLNISSDVPNPKIMLMREYYELLGFEMAIQIERRINANALFCAPDYGAVCDRRTHMNPNGQNES